MDARCFSLDAVHHILKYGRSTRIRDTKLFAIGRKEVSDCHRLGLDLSRYEGVQVVNTADGAILTVYRNHDLRGLRADKRPYFSTEYSNVHRGYEQPIAWS